MKQLLKPKLAYRQKFVCVVMSSLINWLFSIDLINY